MVGSDSQGGRQTKTTTQIVLQVCSFYLDTEKQKNNETSWQELRGLQRNPPGGVTGQRHGDHRMFLFSNDKRRKTNIGESCYWLVYDETSQAVFCSVCCQHTSDAN